MRWRSTECALLPCFNALPDVLVVMNCSVLTLSLGAVFCSDLPTWSADVIYVRYILTCSILEFGKGACDQAVAQGITRSLHGICLYVSKKTTCRYLAQMH